MIQVRNLRLLNLTVFLIVMIMIIISTISMSNGQLKAAAIVLCAAFGLVQGLGFGKANTLSRLAIYFIIQVTIILTLLRVSSPRDVFSFFFYILTLEAVLVLPARPAIAWVTGFFLLTSLNALWNQGIGGIIGMLFYAAAFMLTAIFGYTLRQAEIARNKNEELLEELKTTQLQLQNMAVNEERTRMAREMHDSLGHRLTVSIVQLEGAQRLIPTEPERAARMIGAMRDEMKEALTELRRTVTALRVPIAEDASLDIALTTLTQTFQQNTGIPIHLSVSPGFPELPAMHRLALYRAAQEALTNIQRHAMAEHAWLELNAGDQNITLVMQDDGKGIGQIPINNASSGLLGLKERAVELGGEIVIVERQGGGTQLTFTFPRPQQGVNL